MRCAVIECCKPVWSLNLSFRFLTMGEDNGVRVLNLSSLVKGKVKKVKNLGLPNGIIGDDCFDEPSEKVACNCHLDEKNDEHCISVIEAIFLGEKIQDIVPLAANGLLIIGQGY